MASVDKPHQDSAEREAARRIVNDDLLQSWAGVFRFEPGDVTLLSDVLLSGDFATVLWSVPVTHVGEFAGISATNLVVTIDGASVVKDRSSESAQIHTVIDWSRVVAQLGVPLFARPLG